MNLGTLRRLAFSILAAVILSPALPAQSTEFSAKVTGVQEGDILRIDHNGKAEKIRLWGIDAPEMSQRFASNAKKFTSGLTLGQTVTLRVLEVDRFKRQVAFITLPDGRNLNHELVRAGMAWWFVRYAPKDATLEQLEAEARKNRRGLWAEENPTPPWEHRKHERGPEY
jgi:endonuclease YncB( thermonuclease family)